MAAWTVPSFVVSGLSYIDSPWALALARADKAGLALADVLCSGLHGRRPVTLVGYSMGARVMFVAATELGRRAAELKKAAAKKPSPAAAASVFTETGTATGSEHLPLPPLAPDAIILDLVLIGAPVTAWPERWRAVRDVVAGRVVNAYCRTDAVLRFAYRAQDLSWHVAGVGPVGRPPRPLAATKSTGSFIATAQAPDAFRGERSSSSLAEEGSNRSLLDNDVIALDVDFAAYGPQDDYETESLNVPTVHSSLQAPSFTVDYALPPATPCIEWVGGIENVDVSALVSGHLEYRRKLQDVLTFLGLEL